MPLKLHLSKAITVATMGLAVLACWALPFLYGNKLVTGVFQTDIYVLILLGSCCWISSLLYPGLFRHRIFQVLVIMVLYVAAAIVIGQRNDAASFQLLLMLISSIGILFFFCRIGWTYRQYLLWAIMAIYAVEVGRGWLDAVRNDFISFEIKADFFNVGFLGNYLVAFLPLLLAGVLQRKVVLSLRIIIGIVFVAALALLVATMARAAIVGMLMGAIWLLWIHFVKGKMKRVGPKLLIGITIIAAVVCWFFWQMPAAKKASVKGRLTIYTTCLDIITAHPIIGVGPNRFSAVYNHYQGTHFNNTTTPVAVQLLADDTFEAFDSILQILTEYGLIGLLLFIWFLYALYRNNRLAKVDAAHKWLYHGSVASLLALFITSLFANPFHSPPVFLLVLYHLANIIGLPTLQMRQSSTGFLGPKPAVWRWLAPTSNLGLRSTAIVLIAVGFIYSIYYVVRLHRAEKQWYVAKSTVLFNGFEQTAPLYQQAYLVLSNNGLFLYNYGAEASAAGKHELAISLLKESNQYYAYSNAQAVLGNSYAATQQYPQAEACYLSAINMTPSHIYPRYQLIQLYLQWKKDDAARQWVRSTLQWPVKIPSTYVSELLNELKVIEQGLNKRLLDKR